MFQFPQGSKARTHVTTPPPVNKALNTHARLKPLTKHAKLGPSAVHTKPKSPVTHADSEQALVTHAQSIPPVTHAQSKAHLTDSELEAIRMLSDPVKPKPPDTNSSDTTATNMKKRVASRITPVHPSTI